MISMSTLRVFAKTRPLPLRDVLIKDRKFATSTTFKMPLIQVGYKKIHYTDLPPANDASPRETFVLVHGLGSSQNYYAPIIPMLTAQSYRCIALDSSGSGRSPYTGIEQSLHSLATDIIGVMDHLSVEKAVVVGHSMAGMTVPHLAAQWPDRVAAAVLLGPVYPSKDVAPVFDKRIEAVEKEGMDAMANTVPYSAVGSRAQPIHHAFIREVLLAQNPAGYISMCRVIANAWESPPDYAKVKCPVLIIAGDEDKSAPVAMSEKIMGSLGTEEKRMVVLKQCGHWMCTEAGDETGSMILDFFKQIQ